jgi:preprotein translocase subunit YajC
MNWPTIKKYGKYVLIFLIGVGAIILFLMIRSWLKKREQAADGSEHVQQLGDVINGIKGNLAEANKQAEVEIAVSKSTEAGHKAELAEVVKIKDKPKRRQRLAELYNKVES